MAIGLGRRNHRVWDDALDTLSQYRDRAQDLYDDGRAQTADLYHHGRDRAEDTYGHGRRRAADILAESRHRLAGAADALAGRRTVDRSPVVAAATLGVLAGAALVIGALWLLRRPRPEPAPPAADQVDDLIAGDGGTTTPVGTDPLR